MLTVRTTVAPSGNFTFPTAVTQMNKASTPRPDGQLVEERRLLAFV